MTYEKRAFCPKGCAVRVVVSATADRHIADFYDEDGMFMFTVEMRNDSVKLDDFLKYSEALARFYDDGAPRSGK
jgi:hypothetical protein